MGHFTSEDYSSHADQLFKRPVIQVSRDFPSDVVDATTLTDLIDFNNRHNPDHPFAFQESCHQGKHLGLICISFRDLKNVTIACARLLTNSLPTICAQNAHEPARPVALFLESDVTLFVHLAALLYLDFPVCCFENDHQKRSRLICL